MAFSELKILVVDDNDNMRRLMTTILRGVGADEVRDVSSANEALEILRSPEGWRPDVMLVDYVMDGLDGVQLTRRIREEYDRPGDRLPIIIITGYSELWRLNEAKAAGADDFIVKPFTTPSLLDRISRVVAEARRDRPEMLSA
ncbi:MAG TPA: response regulator [Candidatus Sulfotelmatobacter sp.]|jgi:CheY-like chemotaxis protein|nr:response regulator [Candidatus Sulfotelmatobacter sp.]